MLLSDKEKEITAYHEAGHALVARKVKNADPVHKLTIVPRGMALGLMQQLPEGERHTYSRGYWIDQLAVLFGGRAAEEVVFDDINTGASSDIERATDVAKKMICEWGMSTLGPIAYSTGKQEHVFLGKDMGVAKDHSESKQQEIDKEVARLLNEAHDRALSIIKENEVALRALAIAAIERETLNAEEIDTLIGGGTLPPFIREVVEPKKEAKKPEEVKDTAGAGILGNPVPVGA